MTDYSELKRKAQEIRDEVKAGANTANRVGLALEETVKALEAENQRAEQAEVSLENAVQLLQDETEDLPSLRDALDNKQDKLQHYKENSDSSTVEIFSQGRSSMTNDSQGGVACVEAYNEDDTPVARMSANKENGDYASVTVRGNEVHIDGDAVKVNGVDLEDVGVTIVNDLTTGGADKALSAEMGKVLGEASIVDLGETTLEVVNARMREDALPSAERRTMVYKWRFADGGSGFGLSVAKLTGWGYCQYRAYKAVVEYRTVSGSGTPSNWLAWSGTHIKYDPATRKIGLAKWSDTGNETIQNSGETAELPLATDSQDGLMSKTQAAKLSGAASGADLAKKQDKLQRYKEDLANSTVKIREYTEISLEVNDHDNIATVIAYNKPSGNMYIPIARLQSSYDSGDYAKFEARGSEAIIEADYVTVNEYDLMEVIEGYMNDGVELLENGNIKLTLKGTTKEFMPATPSGDPLHYAYETAGAVYNATTDFIVKDAPWKDMVDTIEDKAKWGFDVVDASQVKQMTIGGTIYNYVQTTRTSPEGTTEPRYFFVSQASDGTWVEDETKVLHLPGHWYLNGLGDITGREMNRIHNTNMAFITIGRGQQDTKARTCILNNIRAEIYINTCSIYSSSLTSIIGPKQGILYVPSYFNTFLANPTRYCYILIWNTQTGNNYSPVTNNSQLRVFYIQRIAKPLKVLPKYLSKSSVIYMIEQASPITAITITLHADRYAQLSEDADIVAALQAKNTALEGTGGSVSLVSA